MCTMCLMKKRSYSSKTTIKVKSNSTCKYSLEQLKSLSEVVNDKYLKSAINTYSNNCNRFNIYIDKLIDENT